MRFKSVGFALTLGMALIAVLLGFVLLSAGGLVSFSPDNGQIANAAAGAPVAPADSLATFAADSAAAPMTAAQTAEIAAGDVLFKGNCAQCHAVNEVVVGPALAGITKRRLVSWLIPWIKNSSKVVASGDEYAVAIFNKYGKQQMPSFALSDTEIKSVVAYITSQEDRRPAIDDSGMIVIQN